VADEKPTVLMAKTRAPRPSGLPRERLSALLNRLWDHRVALVVAPAGSGKTTLLAHFASAAGVPVGWYCAESSDRDRSTVLEHLRAALASFVDTRSPWLDVEGAARGLESWDGSRALLVIDDLHAIEDSPAEATVERFLDYLPPGLHVLAASRRPPRFNLSRLRVSGALLEIGSDDLRFRSWEVENLFRHYYREPLPPQDLADLARRTEGWVAGLQLFHLATRGKPPDERRSTLVALGNGSKLVGEYLARNVLDHLPQELRDFLLATMVLGRLSGPLCDALLGRTGSEAVLEELATQQIFTNEVDEGSYRYHEVLRSHLEAALVEREGEEAVRARHRAAGRLLEDAGSLPEALRAYCRGEDRAAAAQLLGRQGEQLALHSGCWMDNLPRAVVGNDPWLVLASARRHRAAGRLAESIAAYQRAERTFDSMAAAAICRRERFALGPWTQPNSVPSSDWSGLLRASTIRDPASSRRVAGRLGTPHGSVVAGIAELLAGNLRDARGLLLAASESPDASPALSLGARMAGAIAVLLSGDPAGTTEVERAGEEAEQREIPWLARLARAALALGDRSDGRSEAAAAKLACQHDGDRWGSAVTGLLGGLGALRAGEECAGMLQDAATGLREVGAGVIEAWARCALALALARAGNPDAREAAIQGEGFARLAGVRAPQALAYLALARLDGDRDSEYRSLADEIERQYGLALPREALPAPPQAEGTGIQPPLEIRCFGQFQVAILGQAIDLGQVKPKARAMLRLLSLRAGRPVHREVLVAALWPDADAASAMRNIHVLVSALRKVLEPGRARGGSTILLRDGDAYRLRMPSEAIVDLVEFDRAMAGARAGRADGDTARAAAGYQRALQFHRGDLLPEDGPAEWVVEERERCRAGAVEATLALAELSLERGDAEAAATMSERGLYFDRYRDSLWRTLIQAHETAGDRAAATRARRRYEEVLADLDADVEPAGRG
jgi:DNA-binding SARP family transcriptional activator